MATVAGIKIKVKQPKAPRLAFADEKYTGPEPEWPEDAKDWDTEKFDNKLRKSFYYYNYYYNQKDCKKYVVEWMQKNKKRIYRRRCQNIQSCSPDRAIQMTACSLDYGTSSRYAI